MEDIDMTLLTSEYEPTYIKYLSEEELLGLYQSILKGKKKTASLKPSINIKQTLRNQNHPNETL
jgi:hypothetical protein